MQDDIKMTKMKTVGFLQKYSGIKTPVSILKRAVLMFIQRSQSLLENLFVAVSFDIGAGATNK